MNNNQSQYKNIKALAPDNLPAEVVELAAGARKSGKKLVLATGVFDLIHAEHQKFLQKAKLAGDILIIGIESDERVREIKGKGRPVNSEVQRAQKLSSLKIADNVFILPDNFSEPEQHAALINALRPSVLAVSSHTSHLDKKSAILKNVGGEVKVVHQHNPAVSTTLLLKNKK